MSLIADKDHLILSLRLAYLRNVDDHSGPRVISIPDVRQHAQKQAGEAHAASKPASKRLSQQTVSSLGIQGIPALAQQGSRLDSSHHAHGGERERKAESDVSVLPPYAPDSHVVIAGLNDTDRHPELLTLYSPTLSSTVLAQNAGAGGPFFDSPTVAGKGDKLDVEQKEPNRARATSLGTNAGLMHTATIYGPGRTGALGMRVSGRRNISTDGRRRKLIRPLDASHTDATTASSRDSSSGQRVPSTPGFGRKSSQESAQRERISLQGRRSDMSDSSSMLSEAGAGGARDADMQIPSVAVQASTYDSEEHSRLDKRSASLRAPRRPMADDQTPSSDDPETVSAKNRNRSNSQPHRPGLPSGLVNVLTPDDPEFATLPSTSRRRNETGSVRPLFESPNSTDVANTSTPVASRVPPPRPPRRDRKSISGHSSKSASAIPTDETVGKLIESSPNQIDGRQRSQSEAIMPGSFLQNTPLYQQTPPRDAYVQPETEDGEATEVIAPQTGMGRTNSESTIFSLASPHITRRRGYSNRSHQSDGSGPSTVDLDRFQSSTFAPVAEDPEGMGGDAMGVKSARDLTPSVRDRASSDPRDAMKGKRPMVLDHRALLAPLDVSSKQESLTADLNQEELGSPLPEPSSSEPIEAPINKALQIDRGSVHPPLTPAISSTGTASVAPSRTKSQRKDDLATANGGEAQHAPFATFTKADPSQVKKAFEERSTKSALSALIIKRSEGPSNPFNQQYKGVAGSSVSSGNSTIIELIFPFARPANPSADAKPRSGALALRPESRSMQLSVRKDATMEELIGYGLYCYVEEDWQPRLDELPAAQASEDERAIRLSTIAWTLRLVEDGEVDDDYPALDRSLTVGKFGADELAVCEATPAQIKQNRATSGLVDKRGSIRQRQMSSGIGGSTLKPRILHFGRGEVTGGSKAGGAAGKHGADASAARIASVLDKLPPGSLSTMQSASLFASSVIGDRAGGGGSTRDPAEASRAGDAKRRGDQQGELARSTSVRMLNSPPSLATSGAPPIFLRILVTPNSDVRYKTTLQVTNDRYLADVLETICKRRELGNADKWAFVVPDKDIVVPLDRTVESLQGNYDLALVRRQDLGAQQSGALTTQSTNPNASIFKHATRQERPSYGGSGNSAANVTSIYKSYTVNRRMPTFLARHERILTIDGDWLHIIPTDTRAFQTQTATTSYPMSSIVSCTQSRLPSSFKLIVARESDQKRYDFEAESSKLAAEIVQVINGLIKQK